MLVHALHRSEQMYEIFSKKSIIRFAVAALPSFKGRKGAVSFIIYGLSMGGKDQCGVKFFGGNGGNVRPSTI